MHALARLEPHVDFGGHVDRAPPCVGCVPGRLRAPSRQRTRSPVALIGLRPPRPPRCVRGSCLRPPRCFGLQLRCHIGAADSDSGDAAALLKDRRSDDVVGAFVQGFRDKQHFNEECRGRPTQGSRVTRHRSARSGDSCLRMVRVRELRQRLCLPSYPANPPALALSTDPVVEPSSAAGAD